MELALMGAAEAAAAIRDGVITSEELVSACLQQIDRLEEQVQAWEGKEPGLGRHWVEEAVSGLDNKSKDITRLILLTALAPYQVDKDVVNAFTTHISGDDKLIGALAWGSFTSSRKIGTWLHGYQKRPD